MNDLNNVNEEISEEEVNEPLGEDCLASYVEDDGREFKCRKKNIWFDKYDGYSEHSGGHFYMTDGGAETWDRKRRENWHFDNAALLSLQPAASHAPEDCDRTGFCSWRRIET